ncbi:hypothetical protein C2869_00085 [Saccharobesus litoralis]|uniref:Pirin n=1 Tax=Saccharobesus litoralis TaxID=2172099 RepID=A0A2S0VL44_9ALTE|nr:pirin family protein [Saccharobesus litoralis]AWB64934.1 hypothetical protein C2869_00085 [Saccharobesus litoralis]
MITHYPYATLGAADHGWLKTKHHFSFAHYYNPSRMGFGKLRVINDDWVAPGTGFPTHPHRNMEIISFIRSGAITHEDSEGNKGVTPAGEVQVMSAGTGIAHSEFNLSSEPLTLYQIWIEPNKRNVIPRWESRVFDQSSSKSLPLLVSGFAEDKDQALFINQQARIYGGKLSQGTKLTQTIDSQVYVLTSSGRLSVSHDNQQIVMEKGDGAEVTQTSQLSLEALTDTEVILIDVAK